MLSQLEMFIIVIRETEGERRKKFVKIIWKPYNKLLHYGVTSISIGKKAVKGKSFS